VVRRLIGVIGPVLPPTRFWAEHESQPLLDGGATALPHAWPAAGVFSGRPTVGPRMEGQALPGLRVDESGAHSIGA